MYLRQYRLHVFWQTGIRRACVGLKIDRRTQGIAVVLLDSVMHDIYLVIGFNWFWNDSERRVFPALRRVQKLMPGCDLPMSGATSHRDASAGGQRKWIRATA